MSHTVAAALLGGGRLGVFHEDFTDAAAAAPRRLELAGRVRVVADDEATAGFPRQFPAVLTAELVDGTSVTERVRENRGGPQRPLSADELAAKFTGNAERAVGADQTAGIVGALWDLRDDRPVAEVMGGLHEAAQHAAQRSS